MPLRRPTLALLLLAACGPTKADTLGDESTSTTTDPTTDPQPPTSDTGDTTDPTTGEPAPDNPGVVCNPNNDPQACGPASVCCSDDPATVGGKLPNYFNPGVVDDTFDTPLFSADNNELSFWGRCVTTGGFVSPFASGCPVACNPTWSKDQVATICGASSTCCQFTTVDPTKDCVIDPGTNLWRSVTGHDIGKNFNGNPETWGAQHTTNQDPLGASCMAWASKDGNFDSDAFDDCVQQLTVADQRGFCYSPALCPCTEDLCDMKNPGWVPRCSP